MTSENRQALQQELDEFRQSFVEELMRKGLLSNNLDPRLISEPSPISPVPKAPKVLKVPKAPNAPKVPKLKPRVPFSNPTPNHKVSKSIPKVRKPPSSASKPRKPTTIEPAETIEQPSTKSAGSLPETSTFRRDSTEEFIHNDFQDSDRSPKPSRSTRFTGQYDYQENVDDLDTMEVDTDIRYFVVGIDYGTTFTSVSYYVSSEEENHSRVFPNEVGIISNWPHDPMHGQNMQIPTETWYSKVLKSKEFAVGQFDDFGSELESEDELQAGRYASSSNMAESSRNAEPSSLSDDQSTEFYWGYQVPYQRYRAHTTRDESLRIEHPKLMLLRSEYTKDDNARLRSQIDDLIKSNIIRKYGKRDKPDVRDAQDVIADFLVPVLEHTRNQLVIHENFNASCSVRFVITVPTIWSPRASRVLQSAMEAAIRTTGFGTLAYGSVDNLFIVSEPEASATYLLGKSHTMLAGDTFVVMDCGGGTVDGSTYTVTNSYPLRLGAEVLTPGGDNCGAAYLNENFQRVLLEKLADETYLEINGNTLEAIVQDLVPDFEDFDKRHKDCLKRPSHRLKIPGLLGDQRQGRVGPAAKGFDDNFLHLNPGDYLKIFLPLLKRVAGVLRQQLDGAIKRGKDPKRVFLIGGFGAAPSLRSYLKGFLRKSLTEAKLPYPIELILSDTHECVTAVSSGAVIRALNLENGPARKAESSYGFLRREPYEPETPGHFNAEPTTDSFDGQLYVSAIEYFILKDDTIPSVHKYPPFKCGHTFVVKSSRLICEEILFVSDRRATSHFPLTCKENRDAQITGRIETDFTFLRDEGKIKPVLPTPDEDGVVRGVAMYIVEYDLVAIVEGRNLRYEARYPAAGGRGTLQKAGQISIASAFKPGTG